LSLLTRYLTDSGIEFLRTYLNLPSEIVPATMKKSSRPATRPFAGGRPEGGDRPPRDGPRGYDREGYRGAGGAPGGGFGRGSDKGGAPGAYQPRFGGGEGGGSGGGFGRGRA
jgi:small subunit ribosomal protein S10e